MTEKYLLGATDDGELVFGNIGIRYWNSYPQCTVSFDTVIPINGNEYDLVEYFQNYLEDIDAEWKWEQCVDFDCTPKELAAKLASECNDIRDALDCSLYPECVEVEGEDWYFETSGCGQQDTKEHMMLYTDKTAYDRLYKVWKEHHLKEADDDVIVEIDEIQDILSNVNEEEWIRNYIIEHC